MKFDAAAALRIINNSRLRSAGWAEYRELGGALAATSDAPIDGLNCISGFHTDERRIDGLLDLGFALLRAFDRYPAVELTPLDRPRNIAKRMPRHCLVRGTTITEMVHQGDPAAIAVNADVSVREAAQDDVRTFAEIHSGGERWAKRMSLSSTMTGMLDPCNTFYLAFLDGAPCGTAHLLRDAGSAGIYAVATQKAFRKRGVSTALLVRAITDARAAGCDIVHLGTESADAMRLYGALGFAPSFERQIWVTPPERR